MIAALWALLTAPFVIVLIILIAACIGAAAYYDSIEE